MEFIFFESALITLPVLKVLSSSTIEHTVMPVSLILSVAAFSVKDTPARLYTIPKISFIPAAIRPPKGTSAVPFSCFELTLINIALLSGPRVYSSTLLLIESKLSNVVIASCKVELSLTFKLPIVEIPIDDFVGIFEEADAFSMRTIDLGLADVDDLWIFEELGSVKRRFYP